jgi:hypothetical protein
MTGSSKVWASTSALPPAADIRAAMSLFLCRFRLLHLQEQTCRARLRNFRLCEGLLDTCRGAVAAVLSVVRQVSDKPRGRKPRAGLGSLVGPAGDLDGPGAGLIGWASSLAGLAGAIFGALAAWCRGIGARWAGLGAAFGKAASWPLARRRPRAFGRLDRTKVMGSRPFPAGHVVRVRVRRSR